jgi:hypothetical protein
MLKIPTATIDGGYGKYLKRTVSNRLEYVISRKRSISSYLDDLFSTPEYTTIGFKLMGSQADRCPAVLEYIRENEIKGVYVVRRNVLKTLISRETAEARQLYHSDESRKFRMISLSPKSLLSKLEAIEAEYSRWDERLRGINFLHVYYENLSSNREDEFDEIREFLSMTCRTQPSTTMKKINPDRIQDSISNYAEITEVLEGTRFEEFLRPSDA